jgi:hypothetical protein
MQRVPFQQCESFNSENFVDAGEHSHLSDVDKMVWLLLYMFHRSVKCAWTRRDGMTYSVIH